MSLDYGPLTFSLDIGERWQRFGTNPPWPEFEVFPTNSWNYGLVLDAHNLAQSFQVSRKPGPLAEQPFKPESAPISIQAKARKIDAWKQEPNGLVGKLPHSPAMTDQPIENVTLIPMGAARLRITAFPTTER